MIGADSLGFLSRQGLLDGGRRTDRCALHRLLRRRLPDRRAARARQAGDGAPLSRWPAPTARPASTARRPSAPSSASPPRRRRPPRPRCSAASAASAPSSASTRRRYPDPVLVSSTDGVGTKLKVALALGRHDTIGIDLVNACVNDIVVTGADPLFFLDYLALGDLRAEVVETIVGGVAAGCAAAGIPLVGGETAQMPDLYRGDDYDLAGFVVGVVARADLIDGSAVRAGDVLIGLPSSRPPHERLQPGAPGRCRRRSGASRCRTARARSARRCSSRIGPTSTRSASCDGRCASAGADVARARAHHRRRLGGQRAAHAARRPRGRGGDRLVAGAGDLQPHPAARRHRRRRDGPHLQRRHRHDRGRAGRGRRGGAGGAAGGVPHRSGGGGPARARRASASHEAGRPRLRARLEPGGDPRRRARRGAGREQPARRARADGGGRRMACRPPSCGGRTSPMRPRGMRAIGAALRRRASSWPCWRAGTSCCDRRTSPRSAGARSTSIPACCPRTAGRGMMGLEVHRSVLRAGDAETGVTIHEVTARAGRRTDPGAGARAGAAGRRRRGAGGARAGRGAPAAGGDAARLADGR